LNGIRRGFGLTLELIYKNENVLSFEFIRSIRLLRLQSQNQALDLTSEKVFAKSFNALFTAVRVILSFIKFSFLVSDWYLSSIFWRVLTFSRLLTVTPRRIFCFEISPATSLSRNPGEAGLECLSQFSGYRIGSAWHAPTHNCRNWPDLKPADFVRVVKLCTNQRYWNILSSDEPRRTLTVGRSWLGHDIPVEVAAS